MRPRPIDWFTRLLALGALVVAGLWGMRGVQSQPGSTTNADRLGQAFAEAARIASPAVVNIQARGVIIDPRGYVITNNHVVAGAREIRVSLLDKREFSAEIKGVDPMSDLAVLKIEAENLPTIRLADSDRVKVGEWVVAIGNPFGLGHSITAGIVSAKGRIDVGLSGYTDFIQTDAAINPGNSGGALVNVRGQLVGINTAMVTGTGGYQGIGFAIPSSIADEVSTALIRDGRIEHGFVGVLLRPLTEWLARRIGQAGKPGELVVWQMYDGPAYEAGVRPGDIVESADGVAIESDRQLRNVIAQKRPGATVKLVVRREGKRYKANVDVVAHPIDRMGRPVPGI